MDPSLRERAAYIVGSGAISAALAGALGRVYGLPQVPLLVLMAVSALLAGYLADRSRNRPE